MTINKLPDESSSYWLETADLPSFEPLRGNLETEAIIVGAGIAGLTTAYLLAQQGIKVTVLEAERIVSRTTGNTTAKLTAQHHLLYDHLFQEFGEDKARLYYKANQEAVDYIRELIHENGIDCGFSTQDAYVYARSAEEKKELEKEFEAYQKLGIDGNLEKDIPLDLEVEASLIMHNQAQFHPVKYLNYLVEEILRAGGKIFENTRVTDIDHGKHPAVETAEGHKVQGRYVAVCSHFPFYDKDGFYFARMKVQRSYLLAAKAMKPLPEGMFISAEKPGYSLRSTKENHDQIIFIGGQGHSAGHKEDTMDSYEKLYKFGNEMFDIEEVLYRWSSQDQIPLDRVPYIGKYSMLHDNIFVATGFQKWGMSNGTLAGMIIRDHILDRENSYSELFSPGRHDMVHHMKKTAKMGQHSAKMMVEDKMDKPDKSVDDLGADEGAIVTLNGKRTGAYKDKSGTIHLVDTTCTHMGCEVRWNNGERSWDCPCHGSRFQYDGEVIEGPTTKPLKTLDNE
ncbi:FAD-dependent oxidoreductase [Bacillus sp. SCS-153A]|uniref:FAD-dependent oxidoreductase n=1 Tax=Rossellomorea sedimentorum TaxID=3115294 RepID=UPI0039059641